MPDVKLPKEHEFVTVKRGRALHIRRWYADDSLCGKPVDAVLTTRLDANVCDECRSELSAAQASAHEPTAAPIQTPATDQSARRGVEKGTGESVGSEPTVLSGPSPEFNIFEAPGGGVA